MIPDKNRVYDGWTSLEGGVEFGRAPDLLQANLAVSAENMVFRGGRPSPRPGIRKLTEDFRNPDHCYTLDGFDAGTLIIPGQQASRRYKAGIMQCALAFSPHQGQDTIMALIDGRFFNIVPGVDSAKVTEVVLPTRNRTNLPIAYMVQADKWLIAQDGESLPILYDGSTVRRADSNNTDRLKTEVPVGTIMAYGMGRICVIVNERDVAFGDLFGSANLPDPADSLIKFTERNFLTGGFDAAIPFQQGLATGMVFFPQLDTSTGNGQLLVFAERGAAAFFLSLPRILWQTSQFQILALLTTGLRGHRSISVVNEDLWFRAEDGYRSYRQARSEPSGWSHIPLSTSVRQFLDVDSDWLLKYSSSIYFNNRIIGTCSPAWNEGRPFHNGMAVVDFDILSSFDVKSKPAWDGHWAKMRVTQLLTGRFNGVTRAFIFGLDDNNQNQLYELTLGDKQDWDGPVNWELVSRQFDFSKLSPQATPFTENEVYDADIWLSDIVE